jgi:pilus assembly protein Flp/PilA
MDTEWMMRKFIEFLKEENGASAGEYALILAIIGTAVAGAAVALGDDLETGMNLIGTCVATGAVGVNGCTSLADGGDV